jgi:hypothetical protein
MFDIMDIFDVHQYGQINRISSAQTDTTNRLANTQDKLQRLENRYERMRLVTNALWQMLKEHTGLTDADLRRFIERVDLLDGKADGKMSGPTGAMDCPKCSRHILKSAAICPWCGTRPSVGDAFQAT